MKHRYLISAIGLVALAAACSDNSRMPTEPPAAASAQLQAPALTNPLAGIPITSATGQLLGTLTITSLSVANGVLVGSGSFTNAVTNITTTVTNLPLSLIGSGPGGSCPILHLHIGAVDLTVLGLNVALAPVDLNITAQSGPGNLLGNLLCAVAHLLDQGGPLAGLQNLLSQINGILAGL